MADNNNNNNIASEEELIDCMSFLTGELRLLQIRMDTHDAVHVVKSDAFKDRYIIKCQALKIMYTKILKILLKIHEVQQNESE